LEAKRKADELQQLDELRKRINDDPDYKLTEADVWFLETLELEVQPKGDFADTVMAMVFKTDSNPEEN